MCRQSRVILRRAFGLPDTGHVAAGFDLLVASQAQAALAKRLLQAPNLIRIDEADDFIGANFAAKVDPFLKPGKDPIVMRCSPITCCPLYGSKPDSG